MSENTNGTAKVTVASMSLAQIYTAKLNGKTTVSGQKGTAGEGMRVTLPNVVSHEGDAAVQAALSSGAEVKAGRTTKTKVGQLSDNGTFAAYEAACVVAKLLGLPCPVPPAGHPDHTDSSKPADTTVPPTVDARVNAPAPAGKGKGKTADTTNGAS